MKQSAKIEVVPATLEQKPIVANLLELYAHDFSAFHPIELGSDGRFGYKLLPLYWSEPERHPFLVKVDGKLAGFVLVKKGSELSGDESTWDMAEFFVLRQYRRRGIGMGAARAVWRRMPGAWEVRVMEANEAGCKFWKRTIAAFTGKTIRPVRVARPLGSWRVFSFEVKR